MDQSAKSERLTAFVSTVVAVAILAAGVTAHQRGTPEVTDVTRLASDLRYQLEMSFRHDTRERDTRLARLDEVMAAWEVSAQSVADKEALSAWLSEAGARSLPGTQRPLPTVPQFSDVHPPAGRQVAKKPTVADDSEVAAASVVELAMPSSVAEQRDPSQTRQFSHALTESPVTPTPVDPVTEHLIDLRQPQSLDPSPSATQEVKSQAAPVPTAPEKPKGWGKNLLASIDQREGSIAGQAVTVNFGVRVNLTELNARIAGYHDALDEVDLALLRMNNADLAVVSEQIDRLDSLTRDYRFVHLYYESLTNDERESVVVPRSISATLAEVERQLKRCQEVRDGDFLGSVGRATQDEISALRARLNEIKRRVEQQNN